MVSKMAQPKPKSKLGSCSKCKCYLIILSILAILLLSLYFFYSYPADIFSTEDPLAADDQNAVQYLHDHNLIPPPASSAPYNFKCKEPSCGTRPCMLNSFNKIKKFVLGLLENKRNGFFVESGSNNGEYMSSTIYLEKDYNWTGLLIEHNQMLFNESKKVNRKAWLSNTCLSYTPNPKKMKFNHTGKSHTKTLETSKIAIPDPNKNEIEKNAGDTVVTVECFPLYTYLLALNVTQIDFLSLNIEGSSKVLRNFPFHKITVKVLKVETSRMKSPIEELVIFLKFKNLFLVTNTSSSHCVNDYLFAQTSILFNLVQ